MKLDAGFVGAKYLWNTGDTSRVIEVKQGGKYSVRVDGGPNCIGTDDIQVTIDPLPKANGISFVQNGKRLPILCKWSGRRNRFPMVVQRWYNKYNATAKQDT